MTKKSSRRDFVKRSAAAIVGAFVLPEIIPSTVLGKGGKLPPSDRVVMGAIGTGSQGMSNMRDFLRLKDKVHFVAVCDVDALHLKGAKDLVDTNNKNKDCRTYGDFREFMAKEKLDAVSIALPDHWHGIIYTEAANQKWDIYGEKPICRTINDGQIIVSAVKKNNIIWQTGSWQRSESNFRRGAELVINGRIGKLKNIEVGLPDGGRGIGTPPVQEVPKEQFPKDLQLTVGQFYRVQSPQGPLTVTIIAIKEKTVSVDFNHPLAGKDLTFDIEIVKIRDATKAELAEAFPPPQGPSEGPSTPQGPSAPQGSK